MNEGEGRKETHPLPALLLPPFFARSLTLVPRSLLIDEGLNGVVAFTVIG